MSEHSADPSRIPARGFGYLGHEVRRQATFPRDEVEAALANYHATADRAAETGDWNAWADLFTDDAIYVEHQYGVLRGNAAIREWICGVMAEGANPEMIFPVERSITMINNDVIGIYVPNAFPDPEDPAGDPYQFIAFTILHYAGDGRFCYEEDIYNVDEAKRIFGGYMKARSRAKEAAGA